MRRLVICPVFCTSFTEPGTTSLYSSKVSFIQDKINNFKGKGMTLVCQYNNFRSSSSVPDSEGAPSVDVLGFYPKLNAQNSKKSTATTIFWTVLSVLFSGLTFIFVPAVSCLISIFSGLKVYHIKKMLGFVLVFISIVCVISSIIF